MLAALPILELPAQPPAAEVAPATAEQAEALAEFLAQAAPRLKKLESLARTARGRMRQHSATAEADSIFLGFRDECLGLAHELNELLPADFATPMTGSVFGNSAGVSLRQTLGQHGFDLVDDGEGNFFVDVSIASLARRFGSLLSPTMRRYLRLRDAEQRRGFTGDAALLISWDELSERIAKWERFILANPDFVLAREVAGLHETYLSTYLTGMDNSRVFDFEDGRLDPVVRESYRRFLAKHGATKSAGLLREYYELLRKNGFKDGPAIQAFLREYRVPSMLGVQPPVR